MKPIETIQLQNNLTLSYSYTAELTCHILKMILLIKNSLQDSRRIKEKKFIAK